MEKKIDDFLTQTSIKLEKKRKKLNFWNFFYRFLIKPLGFIINLGILIFIIQGIFVPIMLLVSFGLLLVKIFLDSINNPTDLYFDHVKKVVLPSLFKKINHSFEYKPFGFDSETLKSSGIFTKNFFSNHSFIYGEDNVSGSIDNISVNFFEVKFYRKDINYIKTLIGFIITIISIPLILIWGIINIFNNNDTIDEIPFFGIVKDEVRFYKGLFMYADFNKNFKGEVFMIPKQLNNIKSKINDEIFGERYEKIKTENIQVEKHYNISTTNKQMAYYVLSPNIIQAINDIIESENVIPLVTFRNGKMYMTIPWERDYFSVNIKEKIKGKEYFSKYISEINSFEKIIKHFNLDNRIWTKI